MADAAVLAAQKRVFLEKMNEKLAQQKSDERSQFLPSEKYDQVCGALAGWNEKDGTEKKATQKDYPQVYAWARKYELVSISGSDVLVFKSKEEEDAATALDQAVKVSHQGRVFEDLHKIHLDGGHCKSRTFAGRVAAAHGKSIPGWVLDLFVLCCPTCCRRKPRKPTSAGHKPILTKGFGSRGQVDLIDFQSCADGEFKFLLTYQDHGIKLCEIAPLTSKRAAAVAFALLEIFTRIGAPAILQTDNGREFSGIAHANKSKLIKLSDEVRAAIAHLVRRLHAQFANRALSLQTRHLQFADHAFSSLLFANCASAAVVLQTARLKFANCSSCLQTERPVCELRVCRSLMRSFRRLHRFGLSARWCVAVPVTHSPRAVSSGSTAQSKRRWARG